jgi:carboxyl-terminal processing protease
MNGQAPRPPLSQGPRARPPLPRAFLALTAAFIAVALGASVWADAATTSFRYDTAAALSKLKSADSLQAKLDWRGASAAYDAAIRANPTLAEAHYGRGRIRAFTGDDAGAAHDFRTALLLRPSFEDAYIARAAVRIEEGDLEAALADVREALRRNPNSWGVHLQMASALSYTGDRDAVIAEYNRAADIMEERGLKALATSTRSIANADRPAQTPRAPQTSDVITAEQVLVQAYIDKPDYGDLLDAAWLGARALVSRQGLTVPPEIAPRLIVAQSLAETNLRNSLDALVRLAAGKVSREDIIFEAIEAMAKSLNDNHTGFLRPAGVQASANGFSYGVGVFWALDATGASALVREVVPGSPAAKAGIRPGDVIIGRNTLPELSDFFTAAGQTLKLTVERNSSQSTVEIVPGRFELPYVSGRLLEGRIGYIRLTQFPAHLQAAADGRSFIQYFDAVLDDLRAKGATRWLLDLRGNPGGSSITGALIAARLGYRGQVAQLALRNDRVSRNSAIGPRTLAGAPLAVLVDNQSSSMAEVVAQTLKDGGRARTFGAQTAGKVNGAGVQPIAGGALEITVARIKAGPRLADLDNVGVIPDEVVRLDRAALLAGRDNQLEVAVRWLLSVRLR